MTDGVTTTKSGFRRLDSLTGVRAVAALLVLAFHLDATRSDQPVLDLARFGFVGVGLFYVLSGFVLAWTWKPSTRPSRFYFLRFARIYPIYLLAVIASAAVNMAQGEAVGAVPLIAAVTLVQAWVPDVDIYLGIQPVFWSVSVEAFFYLTFPFVIKPLSRLGRRQRLGFVAACVGVLGLIAAIGADNDTAFNWLVYTLPLARFPEFLIGIVVALEVRSGARSRIPVLAALAITVVAYAALDVLPVSSRPAFVMAIPFALLVMSLASADLEESASPLRHPMLVKLGIWSYAIYLVHMSVIGVVDRLAKSSPMIVVLVALLSCLLAGFIYELVERPIERGLRSRVLARFTNA